MFRSLLTSLSRSRFPYEPLIKVEISKSRLLNNLNEFRKLAPKSPETHLGMVAPVLKSNAYGHGLFEVAQILERENWARGTGRGRRIPFLVVDSYFEAVALRAKGVRSHILIIGYTRPETVRKSRGQNTAFTVTSLEMLKKICEIKYAAWQWETGTDGFYRYIPRSRKAHRIHLKIDTGMHRQGIIPDEIPQAIELIEKSSSVILEGICSHLSDADNTDETHTESQIHAWNTIVKKFTDKFSSLRFIHLSNTDGHKYASDITANVTRLGIGLYGLSQNTNLIKKINILPVLEMKTLVSGVKQLKTGDAVGYGNSFICSKNIAIATIPVGYFEGLDRRLSNVGSLLVGTNHIVCPIVGRVSMNITNIDVTQVPGIKNDDEVIVISRNRDDKNSLINMALLCNTISYDLVVRIPEHLKRNVVE